jgi:dinuclear metal center YbgI/SA1388 family protein
MEKLSLSTLVEYLNQYLEPEPIEDDSVNGLQVPGGDLVGRVAVATDASLEVFEEMVQRDCDFLFVHHGLFWRYRKEDRITPLMKTKLKFLFDHNLSLYASHLPLDIHPRSGNNQKLFDLLGLREPQPMGRYKALKIGLMGIVPAQGISFEEFSARVEKRLGGAVQSFNFATGRVKRVALITGGGQNGLYEAKECGFDTFITGEMSHYMYHVAKENQVNVILAGHYLTETLGPQAVGEHICERFGLEFEFLDFPTGL